MQMHLDLSKTGARKLGEAVQEHRPILLAREEKTVARRASVGVAKLLSELRILLDPATHPLAPDALGRVGPKRLEVIADCEQDVRGAVGPRRRDATGDVARITAEPALEVFARFVAMN